MIWKVDMYVLAINPARIGHLDVLLPIILQLKKDNPDIFFQIVYLDAEQYNVLRKNKFLSEIVNTVGQAVLLKSFGKKGSILRKFLLTIQLIHYMLKIVTSKRVIFLQWKSIDILVLKFISVLSSLRGKALTYQPMNNHYLEEMRRYFDEYGHPRTERAKMLRDRQFSKSVNTGYSALINSVDSLNYFATMGYSKFSIIGYTHLYPEYIKYAHENCQTHLSAEIPTKDLKNNTFLGIFVNKYWGRWAGRDDSWFMEKFCEIVDCLREIEDEPVILVRAHPTLKPDIIERAIKKSGYSNIYITHLHPTLIGIVSEVVVGLAESTSYHYVMGAGSPYIEYGGMQPENYEIFPEGSQFASYGTIVAENKEKLIERLLNKDMLKTSVLNYKPSLKHKMNLSVFE
jgi:hypothetical protein